MPVKTKQGSLTASESVTTTDMLVPKRNWKTWLTVRWMAWLRVERGAWTGNLKKFPWGPPMGRGEVKRAHIVLLPAFGRAVRKRQRKLTQTLKLHWVCDQSPPSSAFWETRVTGSHKGHEEDLGKEGLIDNRKMKKLQICLEWWDCGPTGMKYSEQNEAA